MIASIRLCATALLSLVLLPTAQGQMAGVGIKGGPLLSKTPSELMRTTWLPGAVVGGYVPWGVGPRMEIQPEVLLSAMGSGYVEPGDDRTRIRSLYLQIPVSFKLYFSNTVNVHAGVQASRLIHAERAFADERNDFTARLNRMDYGLLGGLGLDLTSGLDLTLRYFNGMTPILANDQILFPRNQAVSLTAGYRMVQVRIPKGTRRRR